MISTHFAQPVSLPVLVLIFFLFSRPRVFWMHSGLNNLLTQAQNQAAAAAQDDAEDSDGPPELEDEVD